MKENLIVDTIPAEEQPDVVDCVDSPCDDTIVPMNPDLVQPTPEPCPTEQINISQFFGTLQESVTIAWRMHLKTKSYMVHMVLNDYYNAALYSVDRLIEQYQGIYGVIEDPYMNLVFGDEPVEYFTNLKTFVNANRLLINESDLNSTLDEILGLIDGVLYKINNLHENAVKSFDEFCYENYK
jgi:hypothetical protein